MLFRTVEAAAAAYVEVVLCDKHVRVHVNVGSMRTGFVFLYVCVHGSDRLENPLLVVTVFNCSVHVLNIAVSVGSTVIAIV